eukprot:scaffold55894_cov66-Phaeocystis_antarctica.AAC.2
MAPNSAMQLEQCQKMPGAAPRVGQPRPTGRARRGWPYRPCFPHSPQLSDAAGQLQYADAIRRARSEATRQLATWLGLGLGLGLEAARQLATWLGLGLGLGLEAARQLATGLGLGLGLGLEAARQLATWLGLGLGLGLEAARQLATWVRVRVRVRVTLTARGTRADARGGHFVGGEDSICGGGERRRILDSPPDYLPPEEGPQARVSAAIGGYPRIGRRQGDGRQLLVRAQQRVRPGKDKRHGPQQNIRSARRGKRRHRRRRRRVRGGRGRGHDRGGGRGHGQAGSRQARDVERHDGRRRCAAARSLCRGGGAGGGVGGKPAARGDGERRDGLRL